jgi:hypothetical protein
VKSEPIGVVDCELCLDVWLFWCSELERSCSVVHSAHGCLSMLVCAYVNGV